MLPWSRLRRAVDDIPLEVGWLPESPAPFLPAGPAVVPQLPERDAAHDHELFARSKSVPSFARSDCREALARPAAPSPARGPQAARFCRPVPGYHRRARSPAVSGAWVFLPASLV